MSLDFSTSKLFYSPSLKIISCNLLSTPILLFFFGGEGNKFYYAKKIVLSTYSVTRPKMWTLGIKTILTSRNKTQNSHIDNRPGEMWTFIW